jgi:AraC-like DNA-binding protein
MEQRELTYSERRPRSELQDWIQSLWTFDATALGAPVYEHFVPPDGCISILSRRQADVAPLSLIVVGPRCEPHQVPIQRGDCYDGVRFWPYAARTLFGETLPALVGQIAPLATFAADLAERIGAALGQTMEGSQAPLHAAVPAVLLERLPSVEETDSVVRATTARIIANRGVTSISELAGEMGVGLRQLQRRFRRETGLTLKQFARVRRFREAAGELLRKSQRPWCTVALEAGYADQAHLTREFSQMIGLSAKELEIKHAAIRHDAVRP